MRRCLGFDYLKRFFGLKIFPFVLNVQKWKIFGLKDKKDTFFSSALISLFGCFLF
jgi:hypothetical protein